MRPWAFVSLAASALILSGCFGGGAPKVEDYLLYGDEIPPRLKLRPLSPEETAEFPLTENPGRVDYADHEMFEGLPMPEEAWMEIFIPKTGTEEDEVGIIVAMWDDEGTAKGLAVQVTQAEDACSGWRLLRDGAVLVLVWAHAEDRSHLDDLVAALEKKTEFDERVC